MFDLLVVLKLKYGKVWNFLFLEEFEMKFDNEFEVEGIKKLIDIVILELIDIEIKWVYNDIYDG